MHPNATATSDSGSRGRWQQGASAVEMALLIPLLLLMLDGVIEFGFILHDQSVLDSATSVAARAGISAGTAKLSTAQIAAIARGYCNDGLLTLYATTPPAIMVVQASNPVYPMPLSVTARYTFRGFVVGGLMAALQSDPVLSATTVMYNE
jgi:Flp pilus assembly protein TadG